MNKKGIGSYGLIFLFILVIILTMTLAIQKGTEQDKIIAALNWDNLSAHNIQSSDANPIVKVVYKFIDFIGYSAFEVSKAGVNFSVEHQIPAKSMIWLVLIVLFLMAAVPLIQLIVLIVIFIKELIISRKEKKAKEERQ
jgi:hypothetical protein